LSRTVTVDNVSGAFCDEGSVDLTAGLIPPGFRSVTLGEGNGMKERLATVFTAFEERKRAYPCSAGRSKEFGYLPEDAMRETRAIRGACPRARSMPWRPSTPSSGLHRLADAR